MPDSTNDMKPEPRKACVGCGSIHGGVNVEMNCLRAEIVRLREMARPDLAAENAALLAELAPIRKLRAEIRALPPSNVGLRGR